MSRHMVSLRKDICDTLIGKPEFHTPESHTLRLVCMQFITRSSSSSS